MAKIKKRRRIEGHGLMPVTRKDYIISSENGNIKRYLKSDENYVVKIADRETGEINYYLKSSPVVTELAYGGWCMTQDAVYCDDVRGYVCKDSADIVKIDNKNYLRSSTCFVSGKYYLKTDKSIVYDRFSGRYILASQAVSLHPNLYGKNQWTIHPDYNDRELQKYEDYYVRMMDTFEVLDKDNKPTIAIRNSGNFIDAFVSLHNPKLGYSNRNIRRGKVDVNLGTDTKYFKEINELDLVVHVSLYDQVRKDYDEWYDLKNTTEINKAIKAADKAFSDCDENENKPKSMSFDRSRKPRWGGNVGFDGRNRFPFSLSRTFKEIGGLRYTFGVEIETSNGFISSDKLASVGLCSMGDNSIAGNEYITGVLHGDNGLALLKKQMELIHNECVVDDTCSIHVHVGGKSRTRKFDPYNLKENKETPEEKKKKDAEWAIKCWTPDFNTNFGINAINLGCMIEEDLFKTQPESRDPYKKHCKSITTNTGHYSGDFRGINRENYKQLLGKFVWGRTLDDYTNKNAAIDRWNNQRYKWLNLVNAFAGTPINTIELRIFSPSTVYWKVLQAVRISMAFTWFVENRQRLIDKGGVTLQTVINEAFAKYPDVLNDVTEYITSRTKKFNRTNVYYKD